MKKKRKLCQPAKLILTAALAIALVLSPSLLPFGAGTNSADIAYAGLLEAQISLKPIKVDTLNDKLVLAAWLDTTPDCGLSGIEFKVEWPESFKLTKIEDKGLLGEGDKGTSFSSKELTDNPYYIFFGNMDEATGGVSKSTGAIAYFTFEVSGESLGNASYEFSLQDVHAVAITTDEGTAKTTNITVANTNCSYTYESTAGSGTVSGENGTITVSAVGGGTPQVKTSTVESAITSAGSSDTVTLDASSSGSLALSKTGTAAIANANKSMTVKTNAGQLTFDKAAAASIGSRSGGEELVIETNKQDTVTVGTETKAVAVFSVTAKLVDSNADGDSEEISITSFGGGKVTVTLDLPQNLQSRSDLICWHYTDTNYTVINGSVQSDKYVFETNHFSDYIVATRETLNAFKGNRTEGVTVSGTVTSYGSTDENVTVELIKSGETTAAYSTTVTGNTAAYSIAGVTSGSYTLKVSKKGHAVWTEALEVSNAIDGKNVSILLYGDVNGDGKVTAADAQEIQRYAAKLSSAFDRAKDVEYCKKCANVNGDSSITAADAQEIQRYAAKLTSAIDRL